MSSTEVVVAAEGTATWRGLFGWEELEAVVALAVARN
jgi:hypothetical protein